MPTAQRLRRHVLAFTTILAAVISGCGSGADQVDPGTGAVGLSISQSSPAGATFTFAADVSVRALAHRTKLQSGARGSGLSIASDSALATESSAIDYHILYQEHGALVEVDISPPQVAPTQPPPSSIVWATLRKIHYSSDSKVPQLTLLSGRVVDAGIGLFQTPHVAGGASDARSYASLSPPERAQLLRSKIQPFIRLRSDSKTLRSDFARGPVLQQAPLLPQTWANGNADFEVLEPSLPI